MIVSRNNKYGGYFKIDQVMVKKKSGNVVPLEVMMKRDAVAAIVYDTLKDKYIFVSQWRPGPNNDIVEVAAGTCDIEGEKPEDAMIREIDEELGYDTDSIELISECYMSPGCVSEKIWIYYCKVSKKIHSGGGLENEDIDIIEMDIEEMSKFRFSDAKTIIAVNYVKSRLLNIH